MKTDYDALAGRIVELVGGEGNIRGATHCATRLRLNLADDSKADDATIAGLDGVVDVVRAGEQYQVIIGAEVTQVYERVAERLDRANGQAASEAAPSSSEGKNPVDRFIDTVTGIFTPILPALTAAGMLKAVLALLLAFKVVGSDSHTYQVVNFMADATFYFLPFLLADSAAQKLRCSRSLALMLAGMLLHPTFVSMVSAAKETGDVISVFGLPIYGATYSSSVIPILLGVWLLSKVEPLATKYSPAPVRFFTAPLVTMAVTGIATLCVLGPIGYIASTFIASAVKALDGVAPWLVPTLMGTFLPLLVMTGTHHAFLPIGINNRMTLGFDTMVYPGQLASNVAQGAAALAVSIKSRDERLKQLASATGITAVCGITEPVLFGVTMKIRTNLIAAMAGGGVGGFFLGLLNIKNFSGGSPGLLTLPSYIGLDAPMSNFYFACVGAVIAFAVSFAVSFVLYKDPVGAGAESGADEVAPQAGAPEVAAAPASE